MSNQNSPSRPPAHWADRHLWQIQPIRDLLLVVVLLGLLHLGYLTSIVTVPILLALALAYMTEPVIGWLSARGFSRAGAAASMIVVAALVVVIPAVVGIIFAAVQGAQAAQGIARNAEWLVRSVESPGRSDLRARSPGPAWDDLRDWLAQQKLSAAQAELFEAEQARYHEALAHFDADTRARDALLLIGIPAPAPDTIELPGPDGPRCFFIPAPIQPQPPDVKPPAEPGPLYQATSWGLNWLNSHREQIGRQALTTGAEWFNRLLNFISSLGFLGFAAFLTAFFYYFLSIQYAKVLDFGQQLIPVKNKTFILDLLSQMDRVIAGFIRGRLIICGFLILWYTAAYWGIGVPAPLILGPIVGLLSLLPYVAGLGMFVAMLLMWLDPSTGWQDAWWWILGAPVAVSAIAQVLDDYILTPTIQGKSTGMDTPSILFASIAGGALAGVYGLLIAIPVAACVKILIKSVLLPKIRDWSCGRAKDPLPLGDA